MNQRRSLLALVLAPALILAACGGDVETGSTSSSSSSSGGGGDGGGSSSSSSSSGSSSSSSSSSTSSGAPSPECEGLAPLVLSNPVVSPGWGPGEGGFVTITLTNTSSMDLQYPGVSVSADNALITPEASTNTFFVLFADTGMPIDVTFNADPAIPSGTKVTFTATAMDIQSVLCTNIPSITFETTIQ